MKRLSHNIIFNTLGNISVLIYSVVLLPTVLSMLGKDSVGIIGFYNTIFSSLMFFDFGFGVLANREISRTNFLSKNNLKSRELVDTLEILYWVISFIISFIIFFSSDFIASSWIKESAFDIVELSFFIKIISISIFFRWPVSFYFNVNSGLQNLVSINIFKIIIYVILTISLFVFIVGFKYQVGEYLVIVTIANALLVISYLVSFRKKIGFKERLNFKIQSLKGHLGYAFGSVIISSFTLLFIQMDKLFLSHYGSLSDFGIYSVIFSLSIGIVQLIYPLTGAFFPKINELLSKNQEDDLKIKIELISSVLSTITLTFLIIFLSFKSEILNIWIGEHNDIEIQHVFSILIIASSFYAIAQIPYLVESAKGKVKFVMFYFLAVNVFYIILLFFLKNKLGLKGISYSYLITTIFYFLGAIYLSFKNFSHKIALSWLMGLFKNITKSLVLIYIVINVKLSLIDTPFVIIQILVVSLLILLSFLFTNKNLRTYFLLKIELFLKNVRDYKI